jgi:hypothetical protein
MRRLTLLAVMAALGMSAAAPASARVVKRIKKITTITTTTTYQTRQVRIPPRIVPQPYPVYRTVYQPVYRTIIRPVPVYQTRVIRETWVPRPVYYRRAMPVAYHAHGGYWRG